MPWSTVETHKQKRKDAFSRGITLLTNYPSYLFAFPNEAPLVLSLRSELVALIGARYESVESAAERLPRREQHEVKRQTSRALEINGREEETKTSG